MTRKKLKSKLSKKYVTDGELLKDMRDQLIVELPKLTRRKARATVLFYMFVLGFVALFFVDCSRPTKATKADLLTTTDAEIEIVQMPEPDWKTYGLTATPDHWRIPNPAGRSCRLFDIALTAHTVPYQRTYVRALAQDLAGEARLDLLESPLSVKCPTTLILTPAEIDREDIPVMDAVIRTCALRIADKQIPLRTFVDPHTHHGILAIEIELDQGRPRFEENLSMAFTRLIRFISNAASKRPPANEQTADDQPASLNESE